jgi:hypothetical protein
LSTKNLNFFWKKVIFLFWEKVGGGGQVISIPEKS